MLLEEGALPVAFTNFLTIALGLIVGSFLNVVIARLPHGESVVSPRSRCPQCRTLIAWYDNIPVLSWLALRGRCRKCRLPIPVIYPVVELLTAFLFLACRVKFGWSWLLFARDWPFVAALVAITFIDLRHRIIPDELSLGGLALGLATAWWAREPGFAMAFFGAALGFVLFFGFAWLYEKRSGRMGLGGGDIKLLAMLGAFLGPHGVLSTMVISSVLGSVTGIGWALVARRRARQTEAAKPAGAADAAGEAESEADADPGVMGMAIPYGPFLVIGALYHYLLGDILWLPFTIPT